MNTHTPHTHHGEHTRTYTPRTYARTRAHTRLVIRIKHIHTSRYTGTQVTRASSPPHSDHGPHQIMSDQTTRIRHRRAHQLQAHHIHARRTFTTRMHTHSVQSASITNQIHSRIIHARVATLRVTTQYNTPPAIAAISIWLGSTGLLTWPARTTLARTHARARAARKRTRTRTRMLRRAPRCNILPGAPTPLPRCCTSTATRNNE